jgi:hypothetical protein
MLDLNLQTLIYLNMGYLYYLNEFGIFTMVPTWGVGSPKASQFYLVVVI